MSPEEGGEFVKILRAVFSTIAVRSSTHQYILCVTLMAHISFPTTACRISSYTPYYSVAYSITLFAISLP